MRCEENRKKSQFRFLFLNNRYFSVFLNIVSVSVSVFSNIAISMSVSVYRPTSSRSAHSHTFSLVIRLPVKVSEWAYLHDNVSNVGHLILSIRNLLQHIDAIYHQTYN